MIRDQMDTATQFIVCDALIEWGVRGRDDQLEQAIDALRTLGFESSATGLAAVLYSRRSVAGLFSVRL